MNTIDIRDAFFEEVYSMAKHNKNMIVLVADMSAMSLEKFKQDMPKQFFNVGIAEQNMLSMAAGLSLRGKNVFAYALTPFITMRSFEQLKVSICDMNLPVTIVGAGAGYTYDTDGPTHHALHDIGLLRNLPELTILNPCEAVTANNAARQSLKSNSPTFVRLDKGNMPNLYDNSDAEDGLKEMLIGKDVLIISTGIITHKLNEVIKSLNSKCISAGHVDIFRAQPINKEKILKIICKYDKIVTVEEHLYNGGLGSLICETIADEGILKPTKRIAVSEEYRKGYGTRDWLHKIQGLALHDMTKNISNFVNSYR